MCLFYASGRLKSQSDFGNFRSRQNYFYTFTDEINVSGNKTTFAVLSWKSEMSSVPVFFFRFGHLCAI